MSSDRPDGWTKAMWESPFMEKLRREAQIMSEGGQIMTVNGASMGMATWNLLLSKRDLSIWTKMKMKPTRGWKVTNVKRYFGITGTGDKLMSNFMVIYDALVPAKE